MLKTYKTYGEIIKFEDEFNSIKPAEIEWVKFNDMTIYVKQKNKLLAIEVGVEYGNLINVLDGEEMDNEIKALKELEAKRKADIEEELKGDK